MRRIAPAWLSAPATRRVLTALQSARPLFVGGCVRDALMDRPTGDIDLAVVTPPEETMALAAAAGLGAYATGVDHGVVTLTALGLAFEAATLRRDVATDGRRAVVAFTTDIAEDAARRDFTINALYCDGEGRVIDPLGEGLADLAGRRLRFVGDPLTRIEEDYLRILRFFRFHAQFSLSDIDRDGLGACHALAPRLDRISKERIGAEMLKLFAAADPAPAACAMGPAWTVCLPGARPAALAPLRAAETAEGAPPAPIRRLAAVLAGQGHDDGAEAAADGAAEALKLPNRRRAELKAILRAARPSISPAEAGFRFGAAAATDGMILRRAAGVPPPRRWRDEVARGAAAAPPVTAADLIARGATPGPALGAALRRIEARWIASDFTADAAALLAAEPVG